MAITTHIFRAILKEHKHKPLKGNGLLVGRQSVLFSVEQLHSIAEAEGVAIKSIDTTADNVTRAGGELLDYDLFAHFCDMKFSSLDITDYEDADIVHDMNDPVPKHLMNKFDFIYNGSCLDNLFNPAEFLKNCSKMLKPGGRIINIEHGSSYPGAYLMYSPDWFLDYYAINNYEDAVVFLCEFTGFRSPHHLQSPWQLWNWNPLRNGEPHEHSMHLGFSNRLILSIAEKGKFSTNDKQPVQGIYRTDESLRSDILTKNYARFLESHRLKHYIPEQNNDWSSSTSISNLKWVNHM